MTDRQIELEATGLARAIIGEFGAADTASAEQQLFVMRWLTGFDNVGPAIRGRIGALAMQIAKDIVRDVQAAGK